MEPATTIAILTALGSALKGVSSYMTESKKNKIEKKKVKEMKRKTFADLLNSQLDRSHANEQGNRKSQNELTAARARALQDAAAGIRQSLVR